MLWWMRFNDFVTQYGRAYRIFSGENVSSEKPGAETGKCDRGLSEA